MQSGTVFSREGMDKAWVRQYFKPNACNYCDDVFAEVADIVFMDAWLDRYIQDPRGTNFVVSRRAAFRQYFQQGQQDRQIYLEDVSIDDVIKSQQSVIDLKRTVLAERLAMAKKLHWPAIPNKRVAPARITLFRLGQLGLQHWLISASKKAFLAQRGRRQLDDFERRVRPILFLQKLLAYLQYLARRIGVLLHV